MKATEITFNQPIHILQIFKNIHVYGKESKSFDDRKEDMEWRPIPSKCGHITNGQLYLPETIIAHPFFYKCNLITLEDENIPLKNDAPELKYSKAPLIHPNGHNQCYDWKHAINTSIFSLKNKEEMELHLQYGYFEVGTPARENFKCCSIKLNAPVEIKINGKIDSSLTSRKARAFKEQYFVYDYLGIFTKCLLLKEPYQAMVKQVPTQRKEVNLLKTLW